MGKPSRDKGKRGEREFALVLSAAGFEARRGQQHRGGADSPDVIVPGLPWAHFEVKRTERLRLYDALDQARREAPEGALPVLAHRKNNARWVVVLDLEDFSKLAREFEPRRRRRSRGRDE